MATAPNLYLLPEKINPRAIKKRRKCEIAEEIRAVDAAIAALEANNPAIPTLGAAIPLGMISRTVSLRSLRHYRQRLVRGAR